MGFSAKCRNSQWGNAKYKYIEINHLCNFRLMLPNCITYVFTLKYNMYNFLNCNCRPIEYSNVKFIFVSGNNKLEIHWYYKWDGQLKHGIQVASSSPGGTHIFGRTRMCCPNGSLFYKKSLNMGPVFYPKNP